MGKSSERPMYENSNSSSRESEHDILGFHFGLFGNIEDVHVSNQEISHASFSGRDRSSSNIKRDFVPRTIDENISLIDIEQVNMSDSEVIFPDEDKVSQEIEVLNRRVHHLISLRTQKEVDKEREVKEKLMERDRLLRQIADLELFTQEKAKSEDEGPVIREILVPKTKPAYKSVVQPNREVLSDPQPLKNNVDKGKQKCMEGGSGSKTTTKISHMLSAHEREMERMRKEKEYLQMELDKVELEVANQEVKRKISYLKAPPIMFPSVDLNKPIPHQASLPPVKIQPNLPISTATANRAPVTNQGN